MEEAGEEAEVLGFVVGAGRVGKFGFRVSYFGVWVFGVATLPLVCKTVSRKTNP